MLESSEANESSEAAIDLAAGDLPSVDLPSVDLSAVRKILSEKGHKVILCEGGPTLNAQLVAHDLIDEFCISLSPTFVGGKPLHLLEGAPLLSKNLTLLSVATDDALIFLRYGLLLYE